LSPTTWSSSATTVRHIVRRPHVRHRLTPFASVSGEGVITYPS
jgi:hypothetical protein